MSHLEEVCATGNQRVETRDAATHLTMHRKAPTNRELSQPQMVSVPRLRKPASDRLRASTRQRPCLNSPPLCSRHLTLCSTCLRAQYNITPTWMVTVASCPLPEPPASALANACAHAVTHMCTHAHTYTQRQPVILVKTSQSLPFLCSKSLNCSHLTQSKSSSTKMAVEMQI